MAKLSDDWSEILKKYELFISFERKLSKNSVEAYLHDIRELEIFITENYGVQPRDVTAEMVQSFMVELYERRSEKSTQSRRLSGLRSFFRFLIISDVITTDPTEFVDFPKSSRHLPDVLSVEEIDQIVLSIDLSTAYGQRDRAMVEMLYSCGLRVSELINIKHSDMYLDEMVLRVTGKGDKQRYVPMSPEAKEQVLLYLSNAPRAADAKSGEYVFLNLRGKRISRISVFNMIKRAVASAGITKTISPHTFRHSFATHLLQGGANIRQVQDLLGHESVMTTEIYTHINNDQLRGVIDDFHPLSRK